MNENQQLGVHYLDNGYSYPVSEGYVSFFDSVSAAPSNYVNLGQMHHQEAAYWSIHMNSYRYGLSGSESMYYGISDDIDPTPRMDYTRRAWEYPSMATTEHPITVDIPSEQSTTAAVHSILEEHAGSPNHQDTQVQVSLEDDIDPDTMTYEELLDLGEAVGTQSRGLSQELIDLLPTSKHKSGIFSRRKSVERCVICQMRYKRGDRQINLPCKHAYHIDCGSKWLSINKTCPVCNSEVFGDESAQ